MHTDKKLPGKDCGVSEGNFPGPGKCFQKGSDVFMGSYEKTCPYCKISSSLPYGPNLKTATIFECGRYGFGKRVTE